MPRRAGLQTTRRAITPSPGAISVPDDPSLESSDLAMRRRGRWALAGVDGDQVLAAREGDQLGRRVHEPKLAAELAPQLDQASIERQDRARVAALVGDVAGRRVGRRQPRQPGREAARRATRPTASGCGRRRGRSDRRAARPAARRPSRARRPGRRRRSRAASAAAAPPRGLRVRRAGSRGAGSRGWRAPRRRPPSSLASAIDRAQPRRVPGRVQELEAEREVEVLEVRRQAGGRQIDLADQQRVARGLAQRAERRGRSRGRCASGPGRSPRARPARAAPGRPSPAGSSRSSRSFIARSIASRRKPSTPRSRQKRTTPATASRTSGLRQSRSGCSG